MDEDDSTLDIVSQPKLLSVSEEKHLTVKLPRSMVLHELDVETVSAAVSVDLTDEDTLTLNELDVTSVSGTVYVNAANAGEISLSTTSGAISGSVRTQNLEADSVSGSVELTLDVLPTELDMETSSGPVTLTLPARGHRTIAVRGVPHHQRTVRQRRTRDAHEGRALGIADRQRQRDHRPGAVTA